MSKRIRLRLWLIEKLAGRSMIVLNARITHVGLSSPLYRDARGGLLANIVVDGTPPDIGDYGFRKTGEEPPP